MPKTRLFTQGRQILIDHARTKIVCPVEKAAAQRALADLTALTDVLAETNFPEREMRILHKYHKVTTRPFIELKRFDNDACEHAPVSAPRWFPSSTYSNSCANAVKLPLDHAVWPLLGAWKAAQTAHDEAREAVLGDYRALINESRHFEDVVAVWPEAQEMASRVGQRASLAIARVSDDLIARIKADVAGRAVAST